MSSKNNGKLGERGNMSEPSKLQEIFEKYGECLGKTFSASEIGAEKLFKELEEAKKRFKKLSDTKRTCHLTKEKDI